MIHVVWNCTCICFFTCGPDFTVKTKTLRLAAVWEAQLTYMHNYSTVYIMYISIQSELHVQSQVRCWASSHMHIVKVWVISVLLTLQAFVYFYIARTATKRDRQRYAVDIAKDHTANGAPSNTTEITIEQFEITARNQQETVAMLLEPGKEIGECGRVRLCRRQQAARAQIRRVE